MHTDVSAVHFNKNEHTKILNSVTNEHTDTDSNHIRYIPSLPK